MLPLRRATTSLLSVARRRNDIVRSLSSSKAADGGPSDRPKDSSTTEAATTHRPESLRTSELPPLEVPPFPVLFGTHMKALVKSDRSEGLDMTDVPRPAIGPNDVLIKIKNTAICGTDVHIYKWDEWAARTIPTPMVVGHEYCGTVEEVGSEVTGFEIGDRVTGEGHITCGHCRNCRAGKQHLCRNTVGVGVNRPGAFAEYFALPARNVFKLHDDVSDDVASFMDALGNAVHTALSFDLIGEDVLVTGSGPIGVMAVGVCRSVGARHVVVTDVNDYRLDLAKQCGASAVVNVSNSDLKKTMDNLGMVEGFDVGLEMSGNASGVQTMLSHMNMGGRIALLGIPPGNISLNFDDIIFKGLTMKGIYGREMFETWYKMQNLLIGGLDKKIDPVITHRYAADDFQQGFETMTGGQSGKVILNWQ